MNDPPAPDQLRDVRAQYTDKRYKEFVTNSTYYYFLNNDVAPFDNPRSARRSTTRSTSAPSPACSAACSSPAATSCRPA